MADEHADPLERLDAADLDDFVAERKRLAAELRAEGRDEEAAEIAAKRKPSLPVFVVNRLARARPDPVNSLLEAAERLRAAVGSGVELGEAQGELGERVRALAREGEAVSGHELSDAMLQRVTKLLRLSALDAKSAPLLRRGVLEDELEPAGFEALAEISLPTAGEKPARGASSRPKTPEPKAADVRQERLERELAQAREELQDAKSALRAAERAASTARKRVERLEGRLGPADARQ